MRRSMVILLAMNVCVENVCVKERSRVKDRILSTWDDRNWFLATFETSSYNLIIINNIYSSVTVIIMEKKIFCAPPGFVEVLFSETAGNFLS